MRRFRLPTDSEVLAELAKGKLRATIPALEEALVGRFDRQHALIVSAILAHLDFLDEQIQLLSDEIEAQLAPFGKAVEKAVDGVTLFGARA